MPATTDPLLALTASDLMSRDVVTISQDMSLRAASALFCRRQIGEAAVVDSRGRCVGMLSAADLLRWALQAASGPEHVPPPACPYQERGRLLTGEDAVICARSPGSCPSQEMRPMTGGRHTAVCRMRECVGGDWPGIAAGEHADAVRSYMTADFEVEAGTPLPTLARAAADAHVHRLIVVDEPHRPIGAVSCLDLLAALAHSIGRRAVQTA
jgi:CBS-domain-containing membrane protein